MQNLLYLRNIHLKELQIIINFLYLGQTEVDQDDIENFLEVAKDLEIIGLSEKRETKPNIDRPMIVSEVNTVKEEQIQFCEEPPFNNFYAPK